MEDGGDGPSSSAFRRKYAGVLALVVSVCLSGVYLSRTKQESVLRVDIKPVAAAASNVLQLSGPGTIYVCGYGKAFLHEGKAQDDILWRQVFPEYRFNVGNFSADMESSDTDIYLTDGGGFAPLCKHIFANRNQYMKWLFACKGKILVTNPPIGKWKEEGFVDERIYQLGTNPDGPRSIRLRFVQKMILSFDDETLERLFVPERKVRSTKERFLVYAQSHCVGYREEALAQFSFIDTVDIAGSCNGTESLVLQPNSANVRLAPKHVREAHWRDNAQVFATYRYCLVLENRQAKGYVSEKILNAFLGGCVPIYYGDRDGVRKLFNDRAFVYYDPDDPEPALRQIRHLEANPSAYENLLSEPILAHGNATIKEFFSLRDSIGDGALKSRIHALIFGQV